MKSVLFTNIILFFYCVCFCYIARDIYILRSLYNSFYDGNSLLFSVFMVLYNRAQIRVIPSFWIKLMYINISFFGFSLLVKNLLHRVLIYDENNFCLEATSGQMIPVTSYLLSADNEVLLVPLFCGFLTSVLCTPINFQQS